MAQKIQTLFIDDIDGGEAQGTVRFAIDGTDYEIDLSAQHDQELRDIFKNYIAHARKVGGTARRGTSRVARKPSAIDTVAARAWAREKGYDIKERGRVPAEVVAKYREATGRLEQVALGWPLQSLAFGLDLQPALRQGIQDLVLLEAPEDHPVAILRGEHNSLCHCKSDHER